LKRTLSLAALLLFAFPVLNAQKPVTNDTIVKMTKAGLTDDIILNTVNTMESTYDVSPDALITLKENGVSLQVIAALQNNFIRTHYGASVATAKPAPVQPIPQTAAPDKVPAEAASVPAPSPTVAQVTVPANPTQKHIRPNVYFSALGVPAGVVSSLQDQTAVLAKNFEGVCSNASVIDDVQTSDYRLVLKHSNGGFGRPADTLIELRDSNDNVIIPAAKFKVGPEILSLTCNAITSDWNAKYAPAAAVNPSRSESNLATSSKQQPAPLPHTPAS
jgi:hypothetical protein